MKMANGFFSHLYRLSDTTQLIKHFLNYQFNCNTQNKWIQEIKSDMKDLAVTEEIIEERVERKS